MGDCILHKFINTHDIMNTTKNELWFFNLTCKYT